MPVQSYASLADIKKELSIATTQTTFDDELMDLITKADSYINLRLQKFTSLPVQTEIASQVAEIEARMVAVRWRLRRAAPTDYGTYNNVLTQIETQFQNFLIQNFRTTFRTVGSQTRRRQHYNDGRPGLWNQYDDAGSGGY